MIKTIGCLSYMPLGYSTPQITYLLRSLVDIYQPEVPVAVFAPWLENYPVRDDHFPDFSVFHFCPETEHQRALRSVVPKLVAYVRESGFQKIGIYGAGIHTRAFLRLWRLHQGPEITTLITTLPPVRRVFENLPVVGINELQPGSLDFVILSSHAFEREMAAEMRRRRPEIPFVAVYDPHLSNFPSDRPPHVSRLLPLDYEDFRAISAARWLDTFQPDLLVCTHFTYFEALLRARHRPQFLIYYCFELPGGSDGSELKSKHWEEHNLLRSHVNLAIFSERNRRDYYNRLFDFADVPSIVLYNTQPLAQKSPVSMQSRNGKILIQGALSARRNYIDYLVRRRRPVPAFDVFGLLQEHDPAKEILTDQSLAEQHGFSYQGFLDNRSLAALRPYYSYLYVAWHPSTFDTLYACPNKFFEAIADGVPPIAAPHPQCQEIIERYDCGILLKDWSLTAFEQGLEEAEKIFGTSRYEQLVANCRLAHEQELCWEKQFEQVKRYLPKHSRKGFGSQTRRKKFVLLDPSLRNESGHFCTYAEHVLESARGWGFENIVGTNRRLEVRLGAADRVQPVYWCDYWGRNVSLPNRPKREDAGWLFIQQTHRLLERERLQPGDHIFIPNLSDSDLVHLAIYLVSGASLEGPTWHLFLRRDIPETDQTRIYALRALEKEIRRGRVKLYTDTRELAKQHEALTGFSPTVLPIPVSTQPLSALSSGRRDSLCIAYLGDARAEKGFHKLPDLVRATQELIQRGDLSYVIQTFGSTADPECEQAAAELSSLALGPEGRLLEDRLSSEQYAECLAEADVVLALYDAGAYRRRSSHVVVEALCSEKVVLTTPGTAPASLLDPDSPWLCSTVADAVACVQELVRRRKQGSSYLGLPEERRRELAEFHCGARLVAILASESKPTEFAISATKS